MNFGHLSNSFLAGKHFNNDKELKENVFNWLKTQAATFYEEGIEKLVPRYDTCLQYFGSYVERWERANPVEIYVSSPPSPVILDHPCSIYTCCASTASSSTELLPAHVQLGHNYGHVRTGEENVR
ncbi:UNVERIFIED_CONTAM: hypothetical protein NCL1_28426 [Trichonephila clavipes]